MGSVAWLALFLEGVYLAGLLAQVGVARLCGMEVERVTLGIGRPLLRGRFLQLAMFPLGGTLRVAGLHPTDRPVPANDPRAFANRPLALRLAYLLAWPAAAAVGIVVFQTVAAMAVGVAKAAPGTVVVSVQRGSPAEEAGLVAGDVIVEIDGEARDPLALRDAVQASHGQPLRLTVERDGAARTELTVVPERVDDTWRIGLAPDWSFKLVRVGLGEAIVVGGQTLVWDLARIATGLAALAFDRPEKAALVGPIGMSAHFAALEGAATVLRALGLLWTWALLVSLTPLLPFAGGRFLAAAFGWRGPRRRARVPEAAVDAGEVAVPRGRFPLPLLAALLPFVAGFALTVASGDWIYGLAWIPTLLLAAALAAGEPRAWILGVTLPLLSIPKTLTDSFGVELATTLAVLLLTPATLMLPPVRRWFQMTCPVCGRLAARPVAASPRRSCAACGSSYTVRRR